MLQKKAFTHLNTWMIHHEFDTSLPEKEDFYSTVACRLETCKQSSGRS